MNELKRLGRPCRSKHLDSRRRFSEDFKRDAVRLVVEEKYTFAAAAKAVGVSDQEPSRLAREVCPAA